ncbi:MAG TPA: hypothetical protein VFB72_04150 [Verrucomicrobiae bacterium]|nr:hypothetical protein [Verrucomicrobiae bacterium]
MTLKQQIILLCFSGISGLLFLYFASFNGYAAVQGWRGKRAGSLFPLIGGFCGSFSFLALLELFGGPGRTWAWFAFAPMILDMGCIPLLVSCVVFLFSGLISRPGPKP